MAMVLLGAAAGIFTASRIFDFDFGLFDEPAIEENPTMFENLWNKPMIFIGLGLAGIAITVVAAIGCCKMSTTDEEIPNDELVLRNRNVKRQ